jgi:glycolate oxidase iron-sulfur subunit
VSFFDSEHPPSRELLDDCVHCGFCLPTCPTYLLWGEEMDSPRGRIHLMNMVSDEEAPLDTTVAGHIDACLGCMACVTACPSGVQYDRLLEATRAQVERNVPRSRPDRLFRRLIFSLFPYPARLRIALLGAVLYQRLGLAPRLRASKLFRRLPDRLQSLERLLPPVRLRDLTRRTPTGASPKGPPRRRVGMLIGCVQRVFFGEVNDATLRVLAAEGCAVSAPAQGCCGALSFHSGREAEAAGFARRLIDAFDGLDLDTIVVNVAGCGSTMKEYGSLLADDPDYAERAAAFAAKVRDVTELLAELEPVAPRHPIPGRLAYHDACHLNHAQGVNAQPRSVLRQIPELQVMDIPEAAICCGSAGIYNLVEPEPAQELGRRKVANIATMQPDAIATANAGCLLQIRRYQEPGALQAPLFHPVEIVDASIRGVQPFRAVQTGSERGRDRPEELFLGDQEA